MFKIKCLERCPPEKSQFDLLTHECFVPDITPIDPPKSKYGFNRSPYRFTASEQYEDLLHDALQFEVALIKQANELKDKMVKWAKKHQAAVDEQLLAEACCYKGKLVEKLSPYREAVYECDCKKGYFGSDCSVDREERLAIDQHVVGLMTDLNNTRESISNMQFYDVFKKLCNSQLGPSTLSSLASMLKDAHPNGASTSLWEMLSSVDLLLHAHYDHQLEDEKSAKDARDIEASKRLAVVFKRLQGIVDFTMKVAAKSAPMTQPFPLSHSTAFQTAFVHVSGPATISLYPSDMKSTNKANDKITVEITAEDIRETSRKTWGIFGWTFSSLLFGLQNNFDGVLVSYVIGLQVVDRRQGTLLPALTGTNDRVIITFPLRVNPDVGSVHDQIRCLRFEFSSGSKSFTTRQSAIEMGGFLKDSLTPYVKCIFDRPQLEHVFFTAGYLSSESAKEKLNTKVGHSQREAMTAEDQFELAQNARFGFAGLRLLTLASLVTLFAFAN